MGNSSSIAKIINEYVAHVLPHGKVSDLKFEKQLHGRSGGFRIDAEGRVSFDRERSFSAYFEIKESALSLASLQGAIAMLEQVPSPEGDPHAKLLLAPYLSRRMQNMLRESGIGFIDGVGNAWIDTETVLIDRRGNKPDSSMMTPAKKRDLFADKATLVPRLLFSGESKGVREISSNLGEQGFSLTPGYVSKLVSALIDEQYVRRSERGVALVNRSLFLEEWATSYKHRSKKATREGWFFPSPDLDELTRRIGLHLNDDGVVAGRAGASLVDPYALFDSVDVLAKDHQAVADILESMGALRVERGANINLVRPYYAISSFFGSRRVDGIPVASDVQLYLDLQCEKRRGLEAAEHLFERRILPVLEEVAV